MSEKMSGLRSKSAAASSLHKFLTSRLNSVLESLFMFGTLALMRITVFQLDQTEHALYEVADKIFFLIFHEKQSL